MRAEQKSRCCTPSHRRYPWIGNSLPMKYLRPPFAWLVFASLAGLALFTHPGLADEKGTAPKPKTLPKFADLKSQVDLPDPLTFLDGTKVERPSSGKIVLQS